MRTFHWLDRQSFDFLIRINFFNVLRNVKFNTLDNKLFLLRVQFRDFIYKHWCFRHNMGLINSKLTDRKILIWLFHERLSLNDSFYLCLWSKSLWRSAYFSWIKINLWNIGTIVDWNSLWVQVLKFL